MNVRNLLVGVAAVAAFSSFALPSEEDIVVHFDASDSASLTVVNGEVKEWRSLVGDCSLKAGADVYPDAPFPTDPSLFVTENGRPGVKLSDGSGDDYVSHSILSFGDGVFVNVKTALIVTREINESYYGAIMGSPTGTGNRLMRLCRFDIDPQRPYLWSTANYTTLWINGIKDKTSFEDCGKTEIPHVLTAVSSGGQNIEIFGASFIVSGGAYTSPICYDRSVIHEIVFYDKVLTDEEIARASAELMSKWDLGVALWTGKGETADWNDIGNWHSGVLPKASDSVFFFADAVISLSGRCCAKQLVSGTGGTVKLALLNEGVATLDATIGDNIDIEKRGDGRLILAAPQAYSGATTVSAGELAVAEDISYDYCNSINGLVAHLDASRPETITTNAVGELVRWDSLSANGKHFVGGGEVTFPPEQKFEHQNPSPCTTEAGYSAVRFGRDAAGDFKGTFVKLPDEQIQARTFIFVQTTVGSGENGGLLGMITGADFRLYRTWQKPYFWSRANAAESWVNGRKSLETGDDNANADNTYDLSGSERPNIWIVRNASVKAFDVVGGQYLETGDHSVIGSGSFIQTDIHEVLLYDTALTDDQIATITAVLMKKWGVPPQASVMAENAFPANSALDIAAGATVDLGLGWQSFESVTGAGILKTDGVIDLDGGSVTIGGLVGNYSIVNLSESTTATLEFAGDGSFALNRPLVGKINLTKSGTGSLSVVAGQAYEGETRIGGGTLAVMEPTCRHATPTMHLDASRPETMETNDVGEILAWNSVEAGGVRMKSGAVTHPDAIHHHGPVLREAAPNGYAAAKFGYDHTGNFTGTFFKAEQVLRNQLIFIVTTQPLESPSFGMFGNYANTSGRFGRTYEKPYIYFTPDCLDVWVNGEKDTNQFYSSSADMPNLLVLRRASSVSSEVLGAAWIMNGSEPTTSVYVFGRFYLHEMLTYDVDLSEEQIEEISACLMRKWGVPEQSEVRCPPPFESALNIVVSADATLDFGLYDQGLTALTINAAGSETPPVLSVRGDLDVTETALSFLDAANVIRGTFLSTAGLLTGPFADPVTGLTNGQRVRCRTQKATISSGGMTLLLR